MQISQADKRAKGQFLLTMALVTLVNLFVFFPSFFHTERGDHTIFLVETAKFDKFTDLINFSYSYCRTRQIETGDQAFFRPGFYLLLSLERWFFHYNFFFWQLTGFILHWLVLWQLLRILYLFEPNLLAGFFVLNFSVWHLSQEMVIWHHVSGYILFAFFFLQAFYYFVKYIFNGQQERKELGWMVFYLTLGCLTYEFGVFSCAVFITAIYFHRQFMMTREDRLKISRKWNTPWFLSLPVILYATWSVTDYLSRVGLKAFEAGTLSFKGIGAGIAFLASVLAEGIFFPYLTVIVPRIRSTLMLPRELLGHPLGFWERFRILYEGGSINPWAHINLLFLFVGFVIIVRFLFLVIQNKLRETKIALTPQEISWRKERLFILGLAVGFFVLYSGVIIYSRFLTRGEWLMKISLYYFYFLGLFLAMIGFVLWILGMRKLGRGDRFLSLLLILMLGLSSLLNAKKAYTYNQQVRTLFAPERNYVVAVDRFVTNHSRERDFSFEVVWSQVVYEVQFVVGDVQIGKKQKESFIRLLFARFLNDKDPKYYVVYTSQMGLRVFNTKQEARDYLNHDFVEKGGLPPLQFYRRSV